MLHRCALRSGGQNVHSINLNVLTKHSKLSVKAYGYDVNLCYDINQDKCVNVREKVGVLSDIYARLVIISQQLKNVHLILKKKAEHIY